MINNFETPGLLNFSPLHNCFVLTPPKTGSRNLTRILKLFDFHSYGVDGDRFVYFHDQVSHNHTLSFMENHLDHKIMISCRNPYAIYVSMFRLKRVLDKKIRSTFNLQKEFHEFVLEYIFYDTNDPWKESFNNPYIKKLLGRKIDYRIKLENFKESIFQVPFISNSSQEMINEVGKLASERYGDHSELKMFDHARQFFPSDFKLYYNQESADLIYENFRSKFIIMDYERDSWKL